MNPHEQFRQEVAENIEALGADTCHLYTSPSPRDS